MMRPSPVRHLHAPVLANRVLTFAALTLLAFILLVHSGQQRAQACSFAPPIDVSLDDTDALACMTWKVSQVFYKTVDVEISNGCVHEVEIDAPCSTPESTDCGVQTLAPSASTTVQVVAPATITWSATGTSGAVQVNAEEGVAPSDPCGDMGCSASPGPPSTGLLLIGALVALALWRRREVVSVR